MKLTLRIWRQRDRRRRGRHVHLRGRRTSPPTCRSWRCSTSSTRSSSSRARSRSPSTTTAARASAARAAWSSTATRTGPSATTTCQLHMRHFHDGDTIDVEPWRAAAFPVVKDLVVDRSAFDRIIQAGGYITAPTGARPGGARHAGARSRTPTSRSSTPSASAAAPAWPPAPTARRCSSPRPRSPTSTCCRRAQPERETRVLDMVAPMDDEGFGGCTNTGECATACPKGIPLVSITGMNKEWLRATRKAGKR